MLNVPNSISFLRLLLIPVFIYTAFTDQLVASCLIIFVASFTDWLDGFAARKLNQFTRIGQLLDPISDRLYILALIAVVYYLEIANTFILVFILLREFLLTILMLYLKLKGLTGLPVHYLGKMGAFCLLIGLPGLIFAEAFPDQKDIWFTIGWSFLIWGLFLYAFSGYKYFVHARLVLSKYV
jgi:cardiolipin synthase (CMP-forming)